MVKRELVVENILFKKKDIHKYTWVRQYNGRIVDRTIMKYVVMKGNVIGWLLYVRVLRGDKGKVCLTTSL